MLKFQGLVAGYGQITVLKNLNLTVNSGEIVALVGANGAGKSTLLNTISGILPVRSGNISFDKKDLKGMRASKIARLGLRHVPEGRRVFAELSVEDNLRLGAYGLGRSEFEAGLDPIYKMFPRLVERRNQLAGTMSGGEQQMLAICRALISKPRLLMLDEPSMGLAPLVVAEIFRLIKHMRNELGIGILLVEQNARAALRIADRACVMSLGKFELEGTGQQLLRNPAVAEAFLGGNRPPVAQAV
ncbi:ABC transporter ATP-binding protein [Ferrovibrio sp.]|uniref:ABC transporter ATP-binding protein n=1 Tax=Ferrovibrio sp. TaxID=1917215 RepID=UPI003518815C